MIHFTQSIKVSFATIFSVIRHHIAYWFKVRSILLIAGMLIFAALNLQSQHQDGLHSVKHHPHVSPNDNHEFKNFRIAALIGHTMIREKVLDERFFIPSWGLDIEYWINNKIGIGIHSDLEIETFVVLSQNENLEEIERINPVILSLDFLYRPWKGLVFLAGPGIEFEKAENFLLTRFGIEYEIEFGNHWDLSPTLFYDSRNNGYDTWSYAFGVGKRF